jgi:two-component system LytT family sensor kinase
MNGRIVGGVWLVEKRSEAQEHTMRDPVLRQPRRKRARRWVLTLLSCTVAALLFSSVMYVMMNVLAGVKPEPVRLFAWWLIRFYLWAALAPVVIYFLNRVPLHPVSAGRLTLHIVGSLVFALVHLAFHLFLAFLFMRSATLPGGSSSVAGQALHNYPLGILAYWAIVAIVNTSNHYERLRQEQLQSSLLKAHLAEARLRALQMQLQPHFVFNALHSLSDLVMEEPKTAVRLIARLGEFLRLTLQNATTQTVSLRQELNFLKAYLEIERIRFADRLNVALEIDPESLDAEVPNLILQPLVENAVRHGVAAQIRAGAIVIRTKRVKERLQVQICDDGPGLPEASQEGIGLGNTRQRLRETYGSDCSLTVRNHDIRGVLVSCEIPYSKYEGEESLSNA